MREYLSVEHRDNPEDGCPSAALLDEIGRCTDATKRAYTDGVLAVIDDVAARLAPDDPQSARVKTLSVFALMVGTLQLSRALADRQLADEVLEQGIQNALALLGSRVQAESARCWGMFRQVDDLDGTLASCAKHGVEASVLPDEPNGRFVHILDPEGTKVEQWQPKPMPD